MRKGQLVLTFAILVLILICVIMFVVLMNMGKTKGTVVKNSFEDLNDGSFAIALMKQEVLGQQLGVMLASEFAGSKDYDLISAAVGELFEGVYGQKVCFEVSISDGVGSDSLKDEGECLGEKHRSTLLLPPMFEEGMTPLQVEVQVW
ncbi:MAG: hypothetical protein KJ709_05615 [Nanoarchaeota archaeon]|nr:hypothetical protein [Nanoarchaeota archaeon]